MDARLCTMANQAFRIVLFLARRIMAFSESPCWGHHSTRCHRLGWEPVCTSLFSRNHTDLRSVWFAELASTTRNVPTTFVYLSVEIIVYRAEVNRRYEQNVACIFPTYNCASCARMRPKSVWKPMFAS